MTEASHSHERSRLQKALALAALVVAGESIFFLPFVLPRVFRPTFLAVFGVTNRELGFAFSLYGIVATIAYLPGGPVADRFSPRKLLAAALISTAAGGALLSLIPTIATVQGLYAYWGFTTIALFWAALMKATREWGGRFSQGAAFGLLDGGRGLVTAVTGSLMVALYAALLPADVASASWQMRADAFQQVIIILASITFGSAALVWFFLPRHSANSGKTSEDLSLAGVRYVLRLPTVWLQAFIIICAYVGFKATDDFSLYAKEVLQLNEVAAAQIGTISLWVRPIAAIGAGLLADRVGAAVMTVVSFVLLTIGSTILANGILEATMLWPFLLSIVCASLGIFALRGLYFAIMKDGKIPFAFTGSAVGVVSAVGYVPDIFMGPVMGHLLDGSPGITGHQHVFAVVAGFAIAGLVASIIFAILAKRMDANM